MNRTQLEALLENKFPGAWRISSTPVSDPRSTFWSGASTTVTRYEVGVFDVSSDGRYQERYLIALRLGDDDSNWSINIPPRDDNKLETLLDAWLTDYANRNWSHVVKVRFNPKLRTAAVAALNKAGSAITNGLVMIPDSGPPKLLPTTEFYDL